MKIKLRSKRGARGWVLFTTLGFCGVLGICIGSYLCMIQSQRLGVARAQAWNTAIPIAEAGVEEALAHLNSGVTVGSLATNTWVSLGPGIVGKTNFLGVNYSVVSIQTAPAVTNSTPLIVSTAYVPGPVSGRVLTRTIQVNTRGGTTGGGGAIVAKGAINFSGTKVTVDSFDSSNTNYSTGGVYDPAKAEANADVTSLSTATNAMNIMDAQVFGTTHTVPGVQTTIDPSKQSTGAVGDANWVNGGNVGVESGHSAQDASYTFTDVTLPSASWLQPTQLKGGNALKTNGVTFPYVLGNMNSWQIPDLSSSLYITDPNTVVYVSSSFSLGSGTEIYICPGASLTLYVGAASASIGGQGVVNSSGVASSFNYYGLPSNTSLGIQANASFVGKIYAPEADITLGGGGSTPYDYSGQIVCNSFKLNGHYSVHYDESLGRSSGAGVPSGYAASAWNEF
jgi:hypothetical protein